MAYFPRQPG